MRIQLLKRYKSIPLGLDFELPSFAVITGKNGSGKSHLLEAISNSDIARISDTKLDSLKVLLIGFGGLNPQIDEACDPQQISQNSKNWWNQISSHQQNLKIAKDNGEQFSGPIENFLSRWGNNPQLSGVINEISRRTKKRFEDLCEDDVFFNLNVSTTNSGALFASQLALIFKTYHIRETKNKFKRYLNREEGASLATLSDKEFEKAYGPKPWILVNDILRRAGLTHEVLSPEAIDTESTYRLRLVDRSTNTEISANDLSTGEKVLMSLALAIYNTQESNGKPDLLLLDEPDAPLHPEYSKLLIETLRDVVVAQAGVRVVVTTHSPSTVAMCPDNCLFEMSKATKYPEMISLSRGLEVLTQGIPHLKVSYEERRQVFVESRYDVAYYQRLYQLTNRLRPLDYVPIFLEPHSGTSSCSDVESIATRLHNSGSDLVRGIVDWDGERTNHHPIYVLGGGNRYSIENYILDPLFLGLALVRTGKCTLSEFGIAHIQSYIEAAGMTEQDAQKIVDYVISRSAIPIAAVESCELMNGWRLNLPTDFLKMRGHDWEEMIKSQIPEINATAVGRGDSGLKLGVLQVVEEFPKLLSIDIQRTLQSLK